MLGKLCITANSSAEKLRSTTELLVRAIDSRTAADAASRNALHRFHSALRKALDDADICTKTSEDAATLMCTDDLTTVEECKAYKDLACDKSLRAASGENGSMVEANDSLLEQLLTDEDC